MSFLCRVKQRSQGSSTLYLRSISLLSVQLKPCAAECCLQRVNDITAQFIQATALSKPGGANLPSNPARFECWIICVSGQDPLKNLNVSSFANAPLLAHNNWAVSVFFLYC